MMKKTSRVQVPLVSVCMITYNHEDFVAKSIESVLQQKINAKIELVIGEDNSTDGTVAIIQHYSEKYPDLIRARFNHSNLGMISNFVKTLEDCRGKYIAILEGDDYWIDPYKLQKQVDFLEKNPDVVICCTNYETLTNGVTEARYRTRHDSIYSGDLIFSDNIVPTLTSVFRNPHSVIDIPRKLPYGDWYLWAKLINSSKKNIAILKDFTAVQNIHENGMFSSVKSDSKLIVNSLMLKSSFFKMSNYSNYKLANDLFQGYWYIFRNYNQFDSIVSKFAVIVRFVVYRILRKILYVYN